MFIPFTGREFFLVFHKGRCSDNFFSQYIYINDFSDGIQSISKIFANGTPLFSKCQYLKKSEQKLNEDLAIIKKWVFQGKMDFKLNHTQQAIEVYFLRKILCNNQKNFLKVNNRNSRKRCEIDSKLTIKVKVNFEHISHLFLLSLFLTLNK